MSNLSNSMPLVTIFWLRNPALLCLLRLLKTISDKRAGSCSAAPHTLEQGRPVLLSWTGTMFEYLMPLTVDAHLPETLLERSENAAVRAQQSLRGRTGTYRGASPNRHIPEWTRPASIITMLLVFQTRSEQSELEYARHLPLLFVPCAARGAPEALKNLRRMRRDGWLGAYGFYEAADFTSCPDVDSWRPRLRTGTLLDGPSSRYDLALYC